MKENFLIYGANGYTGELIAQLAVERGLQPIIAGRSETRIKALAEKLSLEFRVFSLDDIGALDSALSEVAAVLHCAGPFSLTSRQMAAACLRTKTHYTDITGEITVFESLAALDGKAKDAGIMILPGVGFDVVPSDCLALYLKEHLPNAEYLRLAWFGMGRMSHGTQSTMTMNIGKGGAIRKAGKITPVPAAWKTLEVDFGEVTKSTVTIPWGDVSTAFYSTGIPNIEVYTAVPASNVRLMKASRYVGWLLASGPVQRYLQNRIPKGGPDTEERAKGRTLMWGEVSDAAGNTFAARQFGPEGYQLTALAALNIIEKITSGNFQPGFQTPAKAYGSGLILEIAGTRRENL